MAFILVTLLFTTGCNVLSDLSLESGDSGVDLSIEFKHNTILVGTLSSTILRTKTGFKAIPSNYH